MKQEQSGVDFLMDYLIKQPYYIEIPSFIVVLAKQMEEEQNKRTELSDEEIEKASYTFWEFKEYTQSTCWKMGAKWYREQLKFKQCG